MVIQAASISPLVITLAAFQFIALERTLTFSQRSTIGELCEIQSDCLDPLNDR